MSWKALIGLSLTAAFIAICFAFSFREQGKPVKTVDQLMSQVSANDKATPVETSALPVASARITKKNIELIEAGEGFHGDQMPARNGERWLGLYVMDTSSDLIFSKLKVVAVEDAVMDVDTPGQKTAKSVFVDRRESPVFLIRNADVLKPGKVQTILDEKREQPETLKENQPLTLQLGKLSYQLMVKNTSYNCNNNTLSPKPSLILEQGETRQVVFQLNDGCEYGGWYVRWAGDLDGDGKLDFYADLYPHENVSSRILFLSSQAASGQLVKAAAEFSTTGC